MMHNFAWSIYMENTVDVGGGGGGGGVINVYSKRKKQVNDGTTCNLVSDKMWNCGNSIISALFFLSIFLCLDIIFAC